MAGTVLSARAREGFAEALAGNPFRSVDDIAAELAAKRGVVWSGKKSDVFVSIDRCVCEMGPVAGSIDELVYAALPQIEAWARENRCTEVHIQAGRQGWAKVLEPHGYEVAAVILRKRL